MEESSVRKNILVWPGNMYIEMEESRVHKNILVE